MPVIEISSLSHPGVEIFSTLTEAQLRNRIEPDKGIFIAESPKVINIALRQWETQGAESGADYEPLALLCEQKHISGDAANIIRRIKEKKENTGDVQTFNIYTGARELLSQLTGYILTRGVLCAMRRPKMKSVEKTCRDARRIVVIDGVVDTTNIGAIFRSAAALGMDAVLLTTNSCDPLNRRAVRVSMGTVFQLPWTWIQNKDNEKNYQSLLRELGFKTVAMALTDRSVSIDNPKLKSEERLAIIMGTEGDGLPVETIASADYVAKIPMFHDVDSLNVAAASAIAFWQLRSEQR